jgi:hypothetical protein
MVADRFSCADDGPLMEVTMTTHHEARLDVLLHAICALAGSLPPEVRQSAGVVLTDSVAALQLPDEASDTAAAADLARILGTLGCMPAVARPGTV